MTMDVILNLLLISYFGYPLDILAAGNLGYMLAHVFALSGFLLLRKDRPNWPRPIKLAAAWLPIAGAAAAVNLAFIICRRVRLRGHATATAGTRPHRPDRAGRGPAAVRLPKLVEDRTGHSAPRGNAGDAAGGDAGARGRPARSRRERLLRPQLPARQTGDRPAGSACDERPDEENQSIIASGSRMKTEKTLPGQGEEDRRRRGRRARIRPAGPGSETGSADRLVCSAGICRVPALPAALARPLLAVPEVAFPAALAGDRDRRPARTTRLLVAQPLAPTALLACAWADERHAPILLLAGPAVRGTHTRHRASALSRGRPNESGAAGQAEVGAEHEQAGSALAEDLEAGRPPAACSDPQSSAPMLRAAARPPSPERHRGPPHDEAGRCGPAQRDRRREVRRRSSFDENQCTPASKALPIAISGAGVDVTDRVARTTGRAPPIRGRTAWAGSASLVGPTRKM